MARDPMNGPGASQNDAGGVITEQVKQGAQTASQQVQSTAGSVAQGAKQQGTSLLQGQKQKATDTLSAVSQAIRQTGQSLEQQNQGAIGQYANKAADQVDNVNQYLRQRDVEDLVGEVESFGRRNPAMFLGGAFALGVLAARFLKSSSSGTGLFNSSAGYGSSSGGYYAGNNTSGRSGTYDYSSVEYGTDTIDGAPTVEQGYASGLTGSETNARTGDGA